MRPGLFADNLDMVCTWMCTLYMLYFYITFIFILILLFTSPDTTKSVGYVTDTGDVYSHTLRINPLKCDKNDTQLHNCEGFGINYDIITTDFVGVACNASTTDELQGILSGLYHTSVGGGI